MKPKSFLSSIGLCLLAVATTMADDPAFEPPHGLIQVEVDTNNRLFVSGGVAGLTGKVSTNAAGQAVVRHNVSAFSTGTPFGQVLGGIAERDGSNPSGTLATSSSTALVADDPGYIVEAGGLPPDYLLSVSFFNAIRYHDGTSGGAWTEPVSDTQLRAVDLTGQDDTVALTGGPAGDLETVYTTSSSGLLGTTNLDVSSGNGSIHAHLGYVLNRTGGGIPEVGAYMIEVGLSAQEVGGNSGSVFQDSDSIFIVFNNQLNSTDFASATNAAIALPEPTTAMMVTAAGAAVLTLRRRAA